MTAVVPNTKKILCLHGFLLNGKVFSDISSPLRNKLTEAGFQLEYIDSPMRLRYKDIRYKITIPEGSNPDTLLPETRRGWYQVVKEVAGDEWYNLDKPLQFIRDYIREHGPYDGLFGFSQGSGVISALLGGDSAEQLREMNHGQDLKFVIVVSSFMAEDAHNNHARFYHNHNDINIPICHVYGLVDTILPKERSIKMLDFCNPEKTTVVEHEGGHEIPSKPVYVNAIVDFVKNQY